MKNSIPVQIAFPWLPSLNHLTKPLHTKPFHYLIINMCNNPNIHIILFSCILITNNLVNTLYELFRHLFFFNVGEHIFDHLILVKLVHGQALWSYSNLNYLNFLYSQKLIKFSTLPGFVHGTFLVESRLSNHWDMITWDLFKSLHILPGD